MSGRSSGEQYELQSFQCVLQDSSPPQHSHITLRCTTSGSLNLLPFIAISRNLARFFLSADLNVTLDKILPTKNIETLSIQRRSLHLKNTRSHNSIMSLGKTWNVKIMAYEGQTVWCNMSGRGSEEIHWFMWLSVVTSCPLACVRGTGWLPGWKISLQSQ